MNDDGVMDISQFCCALQCLFKWLILCNYYRWWLGLVVVSINLAALRWAWLVLGSVFCNQLSM